MNCYEAEFTGYDRYKAYKKGFSIIFAQSLNSAELKFKAFLKDMNWDHIVNTHIEQIVLNKNDLFYFGSFPI